MPSELEYALASAALVEMYLAGLVNIIPGLDLYIPGNCPSYRRIEQCSGAEEFSNLKEMIIHLNDDHEWSFDAIADWLDTLDPEVIEVQEEEWLSTSIPQGT